MRPVNTAMTENPLGDNARALAVNYARESKNPESKVQRKVKI
jgi:hypothetical protein